MGIVKNILVVSLVVGSSSLLAEQKYSPLNDSKESKLCVAAATKSLASFGKDASEYAHSSMPGKGFSKIANHLYCNGENVIEFAYSAGNFSVAKKLSMFKKGNVSIRDLAYVNHGQVLLTSE